jgi:hypothetical protein
MDRVMVVDNVGGATKMDKAMDRDEAMVAVHGGCKMTRYSVVVQIL